MKLQLKRSNVLTSGAAKVPTASQLEYGELAINYNNSDPAIFLKDSNNNVIRISGVGNIADDGQVELPASTTPPNNPEAGNLWFNSDEGRLYIYYVDANTSQWVDASPDSYDPSVVPDMSNPDYQAGTLDDRYNSSQVGTTAPAVTTRQEGALWWNSSANEGKLYVLYNDPAPDGRKKWVEASPYPDTSSFVTKLDNGTQQNITGGGGLSTDGRLLVGSASSQTIGNAQAQLQISSDSSSGYAFSVNRSVADVYGPQINLRSTRGTAASPSIVSNGDDLGGIAFYGHDGTDSNHQFARIEAEVDGTPGANDCPGRLIFNTTADGASNPTERMRIDSSGNLNLVSSNSTLTDLNFTASDLAPYARIEGGKSGSGVGDLRFHTYSGGLSEAMRIDSSGNVGIGTTSPGSFNSDGRNLVVGTGSGGQGMSIYSGNSSYGTIYFADGTSGAALYQGGVLYNHASNFMRLDTAGAERMRIDSSGNVGIGTTTPLGQLTISNGGAHGVEIQPNISTNVNRITNYNRSTNSYVTARYDAADHQFYVSGSEKVRINGNGILFGGQYAAAHALDDYEEGTFTPNAFGATTIGNTTYGLQFGAYVKVGQLCHIQIRLQVNSMTGTGNLRIGGLPFTAMNDLQRGYGSMAISYVDNLTMPGSGTQYGGFTEYNQTYIRMMGITPNSNLAPILTDSSFVILMSGTYRTT